MYALPLRRLYAMAFGAMFAIALPAFAATGTGAVKSPTSKLYVVEAVGQATITAGDKIEPISTKSVYDAHASIIETNDESTGAFVLSNGTGLFCAANSRLEIRRFVQEPFLPNRTDLEVEPSVSQTTVFVGSGSCSFCTSRLVSGSVMTYVTPLADINVRGGKMVVEVKDRQTKVSLFEGDITLRGGDHDEAGQVLKAGQQAIIVPGEPGKTNPITVQPIPEAEAPLADEQATTACMARRTVYFDTGEQGEIIATPITPAEIPSDYTISPARL
ncbi:MAG: hypothetical protein KBG39_01730 [Opitutaceae bacterium]|nr:hypothetical protein [Opitutaceae bacterium]MBP8961644.1 hypothetical protein [Opitutaceae bacterium]